MTESPVRAVEDPERIARDAIALIERKLANEFGIIVQWGAELEYSLVPRHENPLRLSSGEPVDIQRITKLRAGHFPTISPRKRRFDITFAVDAAQSFPADVVVYRPEGRDAFVKLKVKDAFFPDSPYIAYSYPETPQGQLESVIGHEDTRYEKLPPDGRRALMFTHVIESARHTLAHAHERTGRIANDPTHNQILERLRQDWKFDTSSHTTAFGSSRSQGLHINLSLHRYDAARPTQLRNVTTQAFPAELLQKSVSTIFNEGSYLLLTTPAAIAREKFRHEFQSKMGVIDLGEHLEIKRPPMDANPNYTVLLSLLGCYHALKKHKYDQETGQFDDAARAKFPYKDYPQLFKDPEKIKAFFARRFFNGRHIIRDLLNEVEPQLGERFESAITHTPPGQECSAQRRSQTERG